MTTAWAQALAHKGNHVNTENRRHRLLQAILDVEADEDAERLRAEQPTNNSDPRTPEEFAAWLAAHQNDPEVKGWAKLRAILGDAINDREIWRNTQAHDFAYVLSNLVHTARPGDTVEDLARRLDRAMAKLRAAERHTGDRAQKATTIAFADEHWNAYSSLRQMAQAVIAAGTLAPLSTITGYLTEWNKQHRRFPKAK